MVIYNSRNYLGYLTDLPIRGICKSTHSRNYLGYLTLRASDKAVNLHTVEII